jgi:general secretion pathway protein H
MAALVVKALMPTLATGISTKSASPGGSQQTMYSRYRRRGFSLIELLVVITIIGIVMSIALLSLGLLGDDRELRTEARRVIALVQVAQDEAVMQGREFGLELMTGAYRFVEYDPLLNVWGGLIGDETLRQRQLPDDYEFDLFVEGQRILLDPEPASFDDPEKTATQDLTETYAPHVLIFSSGDMTPFELHILWPDQDQNVVLEANLLGDIKFAGDEE